MMALELELPQNFPNLVSGYFRQLPEFTNFAVDFAETLDYILLSEASPTEAYGLVPWRSAPLLSFHEMQQYVSMPNEVMPSDHVSLVCDAQWIRFDANPV
jgi:mRNA deadenylase 3'-5' endonuclease subunit Ccr4